MAPLTLEYVTALTDALAGGNSGPFFSVLDPDVHWILSQETKDPVKLTGTYNLASWQAEVAGPLGARLRGGLMSVKQKVESVQVVGQIAIVELFGEGTQLNGRPYNNRNCWILIFSEETGKVVKIREYQDSSLIKEVMENNEALIESSE